MLLCLYAAVAFLTRGWPLFLPGVVVITVANVLCAVGILLLLVAVGTIKSTAQVAPEPKPGSQLVSRGVYRYLRHPIYTGIVLTVVGLFLKKPTWPMALMSVVILVFLAVKVRYEEKLLTAFYPNYPEYRKQTGGLLPGLGI